MTESSARIPRLVKTEIQKSRGDLPVMASLEGLIETTAQCGQTGMARLEPLAVL